uniref:Immunoglobulin V-set domain-containing protein n=1 Tax=Monopterus albus TaxID=43700 RepID=A0A3Q3JDG4_MONAL
MYISTFTASPAVGQDLMYWCGYHSGTYENKFICKGEDPSTCQRLVSTNQGSVGRRFSMKDDKSQSNITVTVRRVTADDTGTYWCGAESTDKKEKKKSTCNTKQPNQLPYTTKKIEISLDCLAEGSLALRGTAVICVVVLVIIVVLVYKRMRTFCLYDLVFSTRTVYHVFILCFILKDHSYAEIQEHPQKPASGTELKTVYATVNLPPNPSYDLVFSTRTVYHVFILCFILKDHSYAEIQEHPQKPASGTELKTVYATVNLPPNPSAFMFYSEVNSSGEVSGDTYSAVRDDGQH